MKKYFVTVAASVFVCASLMTGWAAAKSQPAENEMERTENAPEWFENEAPVPPGREGNQEFMVPPGREGNQEFMVPPEGEENQEFMVPPEREGNQEFPITSEGEGKPEFPGGFGGQMPGSRDFDMTYTPLVIEKEDLFSSRDLNSDPDLSDAVEITAENNSEYLISASGTYVLSGEASDFTVIVEADKDDKVQIVLNNAEVSNTDFPVIYVKSADKCFITSQGENRLSVSEQFSGDGENNTDAVIFSKDDLTLNGSGTLTVVSSAGNGISAKDDLKITGGTYDICSALDAIEANDSILINDGVFNITSEKDAFHCENDEALGCVYIKDGTFSITAKDDGIQATSYLVIDGGKFTITAAEGLEATYVQINDGEYSINSCDDVINASEKSKDYDVIIEINGGEITIVMGAGDTDGLDANGIIVVNGGTIDVTGRSTFDSDRGSIYNGGTIIVNGTVTDSIPESMMGGPGRMEINGARNREDRNQGDQRGEAGDWGDRKGENRQWNDQNRENHSWEDDSNRGDL